jgi:DNA-binding MarR family transcriptional regulator
MEMIQLKKENEKLEKQLVACKHPDIEIEMKLIELKHEKEMNVMKVGYESKIEQLEIQVRILNDIIKTTVSESINKPTTVNNNNNQHHTQNISFRDCLSKEHTVDQLSEKNLVERLRISMTEQMFYGGLRDIARLCYDCIIKLKDGKMILCCTDVSRGKFKMYDLHGNIKEDIEARYFTDKVGKCLTVAGTEIYNCIVQSIEDEKSMLTEIDSKRREELLDKFKRTCDAYIEIINVNDPEKNSEFRNELAALTAVNAITKPLEPNTNPKPTLF